LGFGQVGFAPPEFPSQNLVLRDVNGAAYDPFHCPILKGWSANTPDVPDFAIRSHNAFGDIKS
jgi:hypothetical protein